VTDLSPLSKLASLQSIDCSNTPVTDLSPLSELSSLQSINCAGTQVTDLSPLSGIASLQSINCAGTEVTDLSPLSGIASLQSIDCSHTQVTDLSSLSGIASLQSINCAGTEVTDLSPLSGIASLLSIDCSQTQVTDLSPLSSIASLLLINFFYTQVIDLSPLSGLASLQSINFSRTQVTDLGPLSGLASLQSINFSQTQVIDLGPLSGLASLQSINFSQTQVIDLGPLSGLASLQSIKCAGTEVTDLSPLSGLASLQSINFSQTQVIDLSPLSGLDSLQSIDCPRTQVIDLSPLSGLASLQSIDCTRTQVTDLSPLRWLDSLQSIDCAGTQVTDLSPLGGIASLLSINCAGTQVTDLTPLGGIASLQSINCARTQVTDLTPLGGIASLLSIDCSQTQVTDLSPLIEIGALKVLKAASVPIKAVPEALAFKRDLVDFILRDVPSTGLPAEVLSGHDYDSCLEKLRSHFLDLGSGSEPLPDIKIMVLGNGRIGKTQICRRLRGEEFEENADSTHGVTVTSAPFRGGKALENRPLLHLWDFGGQDIYHGTHALFMRSKAVFFTVWTSSSEDRGEHEHRGIVFRNHRVDYWLEMVRQLGGKNSPVVVIQTQCDSVEDELRRPPVPDELLDQFGFCKTLHYSAKLDRGRAALDETLDEAIQWTRRQQGDVRIGAGRLRVRRRLEKLRDEDAQLPPSERRHRVLKKDFFVGICEEEGGVSNPDHLIDYLHECGVVFHRPDVFDDAIILDQEWALEAIYTLFNREKCWRQLRQLKGRFTRTLLSSLVWSDYEESEQALFIHMMESAGICFIHREADERAGIEAEYIAPDLLPELPAVGDELAAFWQDTSAEEQVLEFPFEYPGLVRSVIAKIGRSAGMNAVYWKNGVCGFERRTQSAIRIDTLLPEAEKPYQLRLRIRTQRGRAKELLEQSIGWIDHLARQSGCENFDAAPATVKASAKKGLSKEARPDEESKRHEKAEPDFGPPPRKLAKSYCVSYAWTTESSDFVDRLCADALSNDIEVIRDKTHLGLGERISKFMSHLGGGDRIFIILSRKYLESPFCMFELFEVWRQSRRDDDDFLKRVRIYRLPDAKINTLRERLEIGAYWKKKYTEVEALIKEHGPDIIGGNDFSRYKLMKDFALHVGDILGLVMDTLQPRTLEEFEQFSFD